MKRSLINEEKDAVKYIVATQDKKLRSQCAYIPGIPTIYLNKVTMILEAPSSRSKEASTVQDEVNKNINASEKEIKKL